ncbi:MAG: 30S ribosome-binding factor RbfA [Clostridia bacterium]|nr:30S ribosome-binding factor RbfA [Clostridia bacterium]MBR4031684.1 30S ribosome-binding factor RbfA [Clostridia bacterium]
MAKYRQGRINDEFQKEIAMILRDVKDPRVSGAFISVTGATVTPDLRNAKVYYSSLTGDKKEIKKGLQAANGFIRSQIARRMNLRITPEIAFIEDGSIEYGAKISKILEGITITDPDDEVAVDGEENND